MVEAKRELKKLNLEGSYAHHYTTNPAQKLNLVLLDTVQGRRVPILEFIRK